MNYFAVAALVAGVVAYIWLRHHYVVSTNGSRFVLALVGIISALNVFMVLFVFPVPLEKLRWMAPLCLLGGALTAYGTYRSRVIGQAGLAEYERRKQRDVS